MEEVLAGIDGVLPYLDDIFVKGTDVADHNFKLQQVLHRLNEEGIHLKREKCHFAVSEIELLGFKVNKDGIQPLPDKVRAIHCAPSPSNKTELQAFLGLLNFYGCFLKNRSNVLEVLYQLLKKDVPWRWTPAHEKAFNSAKELLREDDLLVHYDERLPLILTCDASSYGIGAVLGHKYPDGREAPIAFYSRTLATAERNYSQTDREALAIISGVKKFHQYLLGRKFTIITDHKPLLGILGRNKPLPQMISPRVLRWGLILSAYDYDMKYLKGKEITNADALSRLPVPTPDSEVPAPADILLLESVPDIPVDAKRLAFLTKRDPILSRVCLWTLNGWPSKCPDDRFQPYFTRRNELSVHKDCVLWGSRVIIPEGLREEVLKLLHGSHPGIVRMKGLARSYVWWPKMDSRIENTVKACSSCQGSQRFPPKAPIHPWEWTEKPWSRLHIDFAGPYQGQTFLIVMDSHSKWLEVLHVSSMSAASVINKLRSLFATHGLPDTIVSDNGATFTSVEFQNFLKSNQIRQVLVAPYHPSSNGQAERMVAVTKESLKRIIFGSWQARLARFLFSQHILPNSTTGTSPAELLMKRRLTTVLDRLHPDLNKSMRKKKEELADSSRVKRGAPRTFEINDPVYVRSYTPGSTWDEAVVIDNTGPLSYKTQTTDGTIHRRHVDQMRSRQAAAVVTSSEDTSSDSVTDDRDVQDSHSEFDVTVSGDVSSTDESVPKTQVSDGEPDQQTVKVAPRRSERLKSRPKYLEDFVLHLRTEGVSYPGEIRHGLGGNSMRQQLWG